jgi:hypothetical protein
VLNRKYQNEFFKAINRPKNHKLGIRTCQCTPMGSAESENTKIKVTGSIDIEVVSEKVGFAEKCEF